MVDKNVALRHARNGFRVLPLVPGDRTPLITDWPERATTDAEQINKWWTAWPDANVGIATGGGLVVLDVDNKKGKNGSKTLSALVSDDIDTFTVKTPSGGFHHYFTSDREYKNATNLKKLKGIDIRAWHGMAIAPGSVIDGGAYEVVRDTAINPLPDWLSGLLEVRSTGAADGADTASQHAATWEGEAGDAAWDWVRHIDPSLPREDWIKTLAATINTFGNGWDVIETLRYWSALSTAKYDATDFDKAVKSIRPRASAATAEVGSLVYLQKAYPFPAGMLPRLPQEALCDAGRRARTNLLKLMAEQGDTLSPEHTEALSLLAQVFVWNGETVEPSRIAVPIPTGMGKTTGVKAYVKHLHDCGSKLGLLIAAYTIEQLAELQADLIKCGVPQEKIGIKHSKAKVNVPSVEDPSPVQFLLVAHNRVKFSSIGDVLTYGNRTRQVIWDEALISTTPKTVKVEDLLTQ